MLLQKLLAFMVRDGTLTLIDSRGRETTYGNGAEPRCTLRLHRRRLEYTLAFNPPLYFAEAYMDGHLTFEGSGLEDFLAVTLKNYPVLETHWLIRLNRVLRRKTRSFNSFKQYTPIKRAQKNVAHHYDLSGQLYDLFLDSDRQYSCAYFTDDHNDLERAQRDKKRHIAAKLLLDRPGLKLLDIGSGWGGLGLYLAEAGDCDVTGLTLSQEQVGEAQQRAEQAGLQQSVRFHLRDYREQTGSFDRIVSVGMFEHVGKQQYDAFFAKLHDLMAEDGVCLLHCIARFTTPGPVNDFIRKYIFPGGELPTLAEMMPAIQRAGLLVTDVEILRLHYAKTLRLWFERFEANRAKVTELYDERFFRMWELYLKGCEIGFHHQEMMVVQIQLSKSLYSLPITRDYITDWERRESAAAAAAE